MEHLFLNAKDITGMHLSVEPLLQVILVLDWVLLKWLKVGAKFIILSLQIIYFVGFLFVFGIKFSELLIHDLSFFLEVVLLVVKLIFQSKEMLI